MERRAWMVSALGEAAGGADSRGRSRRHPALTFGDEEESAGEFRVTPATAPDGGR